MNYRKKCPKCSNAMYGYSKQCQDCYKRLSEFPYERFLKHIKKTETCWVWTGCRSKDGYGKTNIGKRILRAHRAMYEVVKGRIPDGMCVCHTCDNPPCVNPDHLWLGTNNENINDMFRKRRYRNGRCKLTKDQIFQIRKSNLPYTALGKIYGISNVQARNIKLCISWKSLKD